MPRVDPHQSASAVYLPYTHHHHHHHHHQQRSSPYRSNSLHLPVPNTRSSPAPSNYSHRSSHYASSSPASPPRPLSPLPPPQGHSLRPPASTWTPQQGEKYPYVKGKKVTNAQLTQLLAYFAKNENPTKEQRLELANDLGMSFKALSIWFQNERANVKKGRSRAVQNIDVSPSPSPVAAQPPSPSSETQHHHRYHPYHHHTHPLPTPPGSASKPRDHGYYRSSQQTLPPPPATFISSRRPLPLALRPVNTRLSPPPALSPASSRGGFSSLSSPYPTPTSEYYDDEEDEEEDAEEDEEDRHSCDRTAVVDDFESPPVHAHRLPEIRMPRDDGWRERREVYVPARRAVEVEEEEDEDEIVEIANPQRAMNDLELDTARILAGLKTAG
ncbi:hypothetical protein FRB90_001014 [Tulasnella sp. 427]|nr:hypothetical protein FRB90_001014 [Tulasnella sp. 427]